MEKKKSIDIKNILTNKDLEKEGVTVFVAEFGFAVKVARSNNPNYQKAFAEAMKPFRQYMDNKGRLTLPDEETALRIADITTGLWAEYILLGIPDDLKMGGEAFPNTPENRKLLLKDNDFFGVIQEVSSEMETFRVRDQQADVKNLLKSSAGKSTTAKESAKA